MNHPKEFAEGLSIGIIMDGNGRWAKQRGLPRTAGHKKGAAVFQDIANYCEELGVSSVTFYAFSTENWKRPHAEVDFLMKLFSDFLDSEINELHKPNLLIPLSAKASRGDQILNARSFERQGFSMVLEEEELTKESLLEAVRKLYNDRSRFMDAMRDSNQQNSIDTIIDLIENSRR